MLNMTYIGSASSRNRTSVACSYQTVVVGRFESEIAAQVPWKISAED